MIFNNFLLSPVLLDQSDNKYNPSIHNIYKKEEYIKDSIKKLTQNNIK